MNRNIMFALSLLVMIALIIPEPALAGPGGKIASAAFETFWGRVTLGVLTIIFLPLICLMIFHEKLAERRASKDLGYMAAINGKFDWLTVQERVKDCFYRVHSSWDDEDLSGVSKWMTDWYWQNQQLVHLNKWKQDGLKNVCNVKKISSIKPILFAHRNTEQEHETSKLVVSITAKMQDYLKEVSTGKVVEGSKRFKDVETVWTFTMEDGAWKVSDIEEGALTVAYAKLRKDLPKIENTVLSRRV